MKHMGTVTALLKRSDVQVSQSDGDAVLHGGLDGQQHVQGHGGWTRSAGVAAEVEEDQPRCEAARNAVPAPVRTNRQHYLRADSNSLLRLTRFERQTLCERGASCEN